MPDRERLPRKDLFVLKYSQLALHPNLREDLGDMEELVASIKQHGVKMPLSGYKNKEVYCVVEGLRRYTAMDRIFNETGHDTQCQFMVEAKGTTEEQRVLNQIVFNTGGKPFTPLEQANGAKRFKEEFGWNEKKIADKLNISQTYVKRLLSLVYAPTEFITLVKKKDIAATFAMDKIAEGKAAVEDFLKTHKDGGFDKYENQDLFDDPEFKTKKEGKQSRITKKDTLEVGSGVKTPVSWNEFKKYADKADYLEMWEGKIYSPQEVFMFMLRLKNNEIGWEDIKDYFMATKEAKEKKYKDDIQDEKKEVRKPLVDTGEIVERQYPK